jgi:hypothetical protein
VIFYTVPWAPGLERRQLKRLEGGDCYVAVRAAAACWQLGIRKGFGREVVKARIACEPSRHPARRALDLGMLEENCDRLAEELCS